MKRLDFMHTSTCALAVGALSLGFNRPAWASNAGPPMSSDAALKKLIAGNARFVNGALTHPHQNIARLAETLNGQHPFAVIFGCSDSRVAPEVIFDQGIGDLFTIRVAGNIPDNAGLGSIEYSVAELKVPLLCVLGHEKCGAVAAAVEKFKHGTTFPGDIEALAVAILPAVKKASHMPGDLLDNAVRENVKLVVQKMMASPIVGAAHTAKTVKIVGARYGLKHGQVEIIA